MERRIPFGVGDGTTDGQVCAAVEVIHAHHDSWPSPHLLVPGLWVEREDHEIPLSRNVAGDYQTSFPCGSPQSYSPLNASGELNATKSSIR